MIHHVALETPRRAVEACAGFYALLGFRRVAAPEGLVAVAAWLERDGQQVHLLFADDAIVPPRGHLAVICADFEDVVARLERAGFEVEPRAAHWGSPRAFVRDPAGHRVELMRFPPATQ